MELSFLVVLVWSACVEKKKKKAKKDRPKHKPPTANINIFG